MPAAKQPASNDTFFILSLVVFNFISFISIGIPLASLPGYIHENLGFSTAVAGIVIGAVLLITMAGTLFIMDIFAIELQRIATCD